MSHCNICQRRALGMVRRLRLHLEPWQRSRWISVYVAAYCEHQDLELAA